MVVEFTAFTFVSESRAPDVHPAAVRQCHGNRRNVVLFFGWRPENIRTPPSRRSLLQAHVSIVGLAVVVAVAPSGIRSLAIRFQETQEAGFGRNGFRGTASRTMEGIFGQQGGRQKTLSTPRLLLLIRGIRECVRRRRSPIFVFLISFSQ